MDVLTAPNPLRYLSVSTASLLVTILLNSHSMDLNKYFNLARHMDKALVLHSLGIATALLLAIQFRKVLATRAKVKGYTT